MRISMEIIIDGKLYKIESFDKNIFYGKENKVLSNEENDISFNQNWYDKGYDISNFFKKKEFEEVLEGVEFSINKIANKKFKIDKYHKEIDDKMHYEIIKKTRDLFPKDLNFCIKHKFEEKVGFELTDIDPDFNHQVHIIVRINRPNSSDYNPPHKDIYEYYDEYGVVQKCINFWIPICGVNEKSMLPLAPKSHRIPENKILRSNVGGILNKKKYRVRNIYEWDKKKELTRPSIRYGELLMFTPNLIHGAAINEQQDTTRVALEYRLFKKR